MACAPFRLEQKVNFGNPDTRLPRTERDFKIEQHSTLYHCFYKALSCITFIHLVVLWNFGFSSKEPVTLASKLADGGL